MNIPLIVRLFGGVRPMARKLGYRNAGIIQGWVRRDTIPARRQMEVLAAAKINGIPLKPSDVIRMPVSVPCTTEAE